MHVALNFIFLVSTTTAVSSFALGPQDVVFHLFTVNNPGISEPLLPTVNSISQTQYFSLARPTYFTIHSHGDSAGGNFNAFVIPAHLTRDANVIAVDWSAGASMYTEGLGNAPQVGRRVADFINILIDTFRYNADLIRIVGVGLGGHIAGIAARNLNAGIPHIVAIDPSLHGWTHHPDILNPNDADVVEVLHATAGLMGYDWPLGDLDFYPNGGSLQSGCFDPTCSHIYAYAFYAESITSEVSNGAKFVGTACESYEQAVALQCSGGRNVVFGGTDVKISESGIYTFVTNFSPPFARD